MGEKIVYGSKMKFLRPFLSEEIPDLKTHDTKIKISCLYTPFLESSSLEATAVVMDLECDLR